jgi:hypothetical protein
MHMHTLLTLSQQHTHTHTQECHSHTHSVTVSLSQSGSGFIQGSAQTRLAHSTPHSTAPPPFNTGLVRLLSLLAFRPTLQHRYSTTTHRASVITTWTRTGIAISTAIIFHVTTSSLEANPYLGYNHYSMASSSSTSSGASRKPIEVLVHNVSHSDLVFSVNNDNMTYPSRYMLGRPKFSHYKAISESIVTSVRHSNSRIESHVGSFNRHADGTAPANGSSNHVACPIGFDIRDNPARVENILQVRFRRDEKMELEQYNAENTCSGCWVDAAYFPLLSILMPKWLDHIRSTNSSFTAAHGGHEGNSNISPSIRYVVYLVTGRGVPADSTHRILDNSTESTGVLMRLFLQQAYPQLEVVQVHSDSDLFKYGHNIFFASEELAPKIDNLRDELAKKLAAAWRENFNLTLSFADGATARVSAINASLKHYK